ncbi:efflux RND transporter periplasmic adaptor subunit [Sutcliffiella cohnii]
MFKKFLLLFLLPFLLVACTQKEITSQNTEGNEIPVTVETVSVQNITNSIELSGVAVPSVQMPLLTTSPLTVEKVHVRIGDRVKKDDLIVTLDSSTAKEQVAQTREAINELENALSKMKEVENMASNDTLLSEIPKLQEELNQSLQKSQSLLDGVETGAVTSLDLIQSSIEVMIKQAQLSSVASQVQQIPTFNTAELEMQLKQARQSLRQAEQLEELTRITSPIDGIISELNVIEDGIATPQLPIATVIQLDTINATFAVNSYQVSSLLPGQNVTLTFQGVSDSYESSIDVVSPTVNQQTNMFTVTVPVSNTEGKILGGMRTTAIVDIDELEGQTVVPIEAVLYEENEPYVFVIENNKAVRRQITVGFRDDKVIQVMEGLSEGDIVVTSGKERLKDGSEILIQESGQDS